MFEFTITSTNEGLVIQCSVCTNDILYAKYAFMTLPEANEKAADHVLICPKKHLISEEVSIDQHGPLTANVQGVDSYDIPVLDELQQEKSEG